MKRRAQTATAPASLDLGLEKMAAMDTPERASEERPAALRAALHS